MASMLQHRPLVATCAGFLIGIAVAGSFQGPVLVYLAIALVGVLWLLLDGRRALVAAVLAAFAVGAIRTEISLRRAPDDVSAFISAGAVTLSGTCYGEPVARPYSTSFILDCRSVESRSQSVPVSGRVYVTISRYDDAPAVDLHDGDVVDFPATLEAPRPASNPGAFSWAEYLAHRGIWAQAHVRRVSAITVSAHPAGDSISEVALRVRGRLLTGLAAALPHRDFAVLSGVLFGLRADIPPSTLAAFVATGTVHILATAGLHIGVLALLLRWAFYLIAAPRKLAALSSIALLWAYDIMAGGRPAVTRAVLVATIYLAGTVFERAPEVVTSLAGAALIILFLQPTALFEPGFQMSFLTVLTLAALMPVWDHLCAPLRENLKGRMKWVVGRGIDLVGLCIFAQAGAWPIVAQEFHVIPLWATLANLVVVPIVFFLIPLGILVALLAMWNAPAAALIAKFSVSPLIAGIVATTAFFGSGPGAAMAVGTIPGPVIACYYILVCGGGFVWQAKLTAARRAALHAPTASNLVRSA